MKIIEAFLHHLPHQETPVREVRVRAFSTAVKTHSYAGKPRQELRKEALQ